MPIKLLWSGGWDSTFRLLYLLLVEEKSVQPYYIVDHQRESTGHEFRAMDAIKEDLFAKYPKAKNLLKPTIIDRRDELKPNMEISRKWTEFYLKADLGTQYEWLALFAEEQNLHDLEMCHEKWPTPTRFDDIIFPELVGKGHECRVRDNPENEIVSLFKYFRFPLCYVTKLEMEQIARKMSFFDILQKVWFCHTPKKNGEPCEICHPCSVAKKSGHSHGLPESNILRDKYLHLNFKVSKVLGRAVVKSKRILPKLIRMTRSL